MPGEHVEQVEAGGLAAVGQGDVVFGDRPGELAAQQLGHGAAEGAIPGRGGVIAYKALESVALTQQRLHALAQAGLDGRDAAGIAAAKHDDVITALGQCVTQIIHQLQDAAFADELFAKG